MSPRTRSRPGRDDEGTRPGGEFERVGADGRLRRRREGLWSDLAATDESEAVCLRRVGIPGTPEGQLASESRDESREMEIVTRAQVPSPRQRAVRRTGFGRVAGTALAIALAIAGPAWSAPRETLAPRVAAPGDAGAGQQPSEVWESLRYRGRNWLARFSVEIEMQLPEPGRKRAVDADWVAELRTSLDSVLLSDKSTQIRAYFDPITGVVRRLTQLSMGPRPDFKSYEFQADGVMRIRSEPVRGQTLQSPERWPGGQRAFYGYDPGELGCRVVSNPAALAWWLTWGPAASSARVQDPEVCYFLGKTLYSVAFEALGTSAARVDYQLVREGRSRRRHGRVRVERYRVICRPIAGKLDEKTLVAEILLDAENRLPWRFVTREGPLRIDVELDRAVLREPALLASGSSLVD